MKKHIFILVFLSIASFSYGQGFPVEFPDFKRKSLSQIKKNKDWNILKETSGDLNYDRKKDLALVLESKDSIYEQRVFSNHEWRKGKVRILLVFLNTNGEQIVHTQNDKFIARSYEGILDEYVEPKLSIENNQLTISNEHLLANESYSFQLKNNAFFILNASIYNLNGITSNFILKKYNFVTHKLIVTTGRICVEEEKVTDFELDTKPKALSDFNEMYEWEVMEDHFL